VPHVGPTLGFRVHRAGVSVTYLSDHQQPDGDEFTIAAGARDVCADTDLLIHDAQYTDAEFAAKKTWGHSTHGYAAWVARTSGARRLALFHHDPSRRDADLDELGNAHRAGAVPSIVAREGMRLAVSSQA
jgi:ribonuclease BN (tRNA processing enzyme)